MRYLLMIFGEEAPPDQVSPEEWQTVMEEYNTYSRTLRERGGNLGGEALQDSSTATTIRVRDGQTLTTDGPFIESKEQFGGYYLLEAKDLDEAIELAALCPGARFGTVEIRPIMEFDVPEAAPETSAAAAS
ncbi:YciI family protein [soil metagenome]